MSKISDINQKPTLLKKMVFYIADSTSVLKDRLCKLGGGIIIIKIKTLATFNEKPVVVA